MAKLFFFTNDLVKSITDNNGVTTQGQNSEQSFGVKSDALFQATSCFTMSSNNKAYAVLDGTILLQQQAANEDRKKWDSIAQHKTDSMDYHDTNCPDKIFFLEMAMGENIGK